MTLDDLYEAGVKHSQRGDWPVAIDFFQAVLASQPDHAAALAMLGNSFMATKQFSEAVATYQTLLRINPNDGLVHYNLGNAFLSLRRLEEAVAALKTSVALMPDFADAHNNLGVALNLLDRPVPALECFAQALKIKSDFADAHNNLGSAYLHLGNLDAAEGHFRAALEVEPRHQRACYNLGILRLMYGDFVAGWPGYEQRWILKGAQARPLNKPFWDGAYLPEKSILVYADAGLGDTLHFVRYLPLVKERVASVVLACQRPLLNLLQACSGVDEICAADAPSPSCDMQVSLTTLPVLFTTSLATIPVEIPYLTANPQRRDAWQTELQRLAPALTIDKSLTKKIGIVWEGSRQQAMDRRSSALAFF